MTKKAFRLISPVICLHCVALTPPWEYQPAEDARCADPTGSCGVPVDPLGGSGGAGTGVRDSGDLGDASDYRGAQGGSQVVGLDARSGLPELDVPISTIDVAGSGGAANRGDLRGMAGEDGWTSGAGGGAGSFDTDAVQADGTANDTAGRPGGGGGESAGGSGGTGGANTGGTTTGSGGSKGGCQTLADCAGPQVCKLNKCVDAQGVLVVRVPLTGSGQIQRYGYLFTPAANLTNRTVTVRVYAPRATGGSLVVYPNDTSDSTSGPRAVQPFSALAAGWKDVSFDVGAQSGGFNPAEIKQITIELQSGATGPWTNPTVVYIDSILVSGLAVGSTFDTSATSIVTSTIEVVPGSSLVWSASLPPT